MNKILSATASAALYFSSLAQALDYDESTLYVHLLCHTHDDVGWLKTVDSYFSGTNQDVAFAEVDVILDGVIAALILDPNRKFTYVEMKFFTMWWDEQTDYMKDQVRQLVKEHRLEFVNAGWSMTDEAAAHYDDMLNNMIIGHEFLKKEFDYVPTIGWHVDPFGHSNANPRLFADMGFEAWWFARADYEDFEQRTTDKSLQFVWRPFYESLGNTVEIFTNMFYGTYYWPSYFNVDEREKGEPVIVDKSLETFNADFKCETMRNQILDDHQSLYRTNHVMIPWGGDFAYGNAFYNFRSTDNLIEYCNDKWTDMKLLYSTPYMFMDALKDLDETWPVNHYDMFPYADRSDDYWTGYFTSRPNSKSQVRFGSAQLHASAKLYASKVIDQAASDDEVNQILDVKHTMMDAMGLNQHHDGVSGTAKQVVADDYAAYISRAMTANNEVYSKAVNEEASKYAGISSQSWAACNVRNGTFVDCPIQSDFQGTFAVAAHNPATVEQKIQRFKVPQANYKVSAFDYDSGEYVDVESELPCYEFTENALNPATYPDCELFVKSSIKPQHFGFFRIEKSPYGPTHKSEQLKASDLNMVEFQGTNEDGALMFHYRANDGVESDMTFQMRFYTPYTGIGKGSAGDPSGAYLFKPQNNISDGPDQSLPYSIFEKLEHYTSELVNCYTLYHSNAAGENFILFLRWFEDSTVLEWEVRMQGIPENKVDGSPQGREVIAVWTVSNFDQKETFFTDSNGLEMQTRVLNFRPTFDLVDSQPITANYYPINSAIAIQSENLQFTVMNDRAQGGSALLPGRIELMQHRRLYHDDNRGVDEALNERTADGLGIAVTATYRTQLFNLNSSKSLQRQTQLKVDEPVQYFFASDFSETSARKLFVSLRSESPKSFSSVFDTNTGALKLHMFPEARNEILIRLENVADLLDGSIEDQTIYFDIDQFVADFYSHVNGQSADKVEVEERSLSNSQSYATMEDNRFYWKTEDSTTNLVEGYLVPDITDSQVSLQPQRIRLFKVSYN